MSTEDVRERIEKAIHAGTYIRECADNIFAIIPLPILAWIVANQEAAKGLAAGTMVAVPGDPTDLMLSASKHAIFNYIEALPADERAKIKGNPHGMRVKERLKMRLRWRAMIAAASTPAPSNEAQGGSAPGDSDGTYEVGA